MSLKFKDVFEKFATAYVAGVVSFTLLVFADLFLLRPHMQNQFSLFWIAVNVYAAVYASLFALMHIRIRPSVRSILCCALIMVVGPCLIASAAEPLYGLTVLSVSKQLLFSFLLAGVTYAALYPRKTATN